MRIIKHHCKFCGADVTLEFDTEALKMMRLETWKAMAACNRCADFMSYRYKAYEQIRIAALLYQRCKATDVNRKALLLSQLEELLKNWLTVMNEYFRLNITWDSAVMNSFLESKVPITTVLDACQRLMRQQTGIAALRIGRAQFPIA